MLAMEDRWVQYNPRLKQVARTLRKNMTLSEILLWQQLKKKQVLGYDFHRQKPIDEYVVDFYCPRLNLVLEIDGDSHDGKEDADQARKIRIVGIDGIEILGFGCEEQRRWNNRPIERMD